jgi:hypothetical protein
VDCSDQLSSFAAYKKNVIKAQSDLYEYVEGIANLEAEIFVIKTENEDNCVVVKEEKVESLVESVFVELPFVACTSDIIKQENKCENEEELLEEVSEADLLKKRRQNLIQKLIDAAKEKQKKRKRKTKKEEESSTCEICNKTLASSASLKKHLENFHSGKEAKIPCQWEGCGKLFVNDILLKQHLRNSHKTGDERSICEDCGASFSSANCLSLHIKRIHLKIRNLACDICGSRFFGKSFIASHVSLK